MVILVQIDRVQESPFFGCDVVVPFFLYAERVCQNNVFHPAKNISLTVAGNLAAQVTDNENLVIMLENYTFPEQSCFQTDIGRREDFICQFQLVIILVLGVDTFTDWVKLAHFRIAIHAFFCELEIRFVPNQRKFFECKDSVI